MARPRKPTTDEIEAAAERYSVTPRTIRRWIEAGVDIDSLEAVADFLLRQRAPATAPMEIITSQIQ